MATSSTKDLQARSGLLELFRTGVSDVSGAEVDYPEFFQFCKMRQTSIGDLSVVEPEDAEFS
jgi:hypothetical protein